jgi:hypothetical protein
MGRALVDGRCSGLRAAVVFTDGSHEVVLVEVGSSRHVSLGLRTGVTAGKQASTTGVPEVTSLAGMRRSECGVVKRFILSRVERRRAQTRRGESQSLSKGAASDTPLETREMRVHVTAVTVGRHRSSSSCLRSSSRALTRSGAPAHSSRGAQAKVSARRKRGLHPGRCRHAERRRKGERVAPLIMT